MDEKPTTYLMVADIRATFRVGLESPDVFREIREAIKDVLEKYEALAGTVKVDVSAHVEE